MTEIPADRFKPEPGRMRAHLFQNPAIGLVPTLYYEFEMPLEPFNSGLEWEEQPVETEFRLEFLQLPVSDWREFDGMPMEPDAEEADGSIYLGGAHNPVEIRQIRCARLEGSTLRIDCSLYCDFEFEMVADSIDLELAARVEFEGLVIDREIVAGDPSLSDNLRASVGHLVALDAYCLEPEVAEHHIMLSPRK